MPPDESPEMQIAALRELVAQTAQDWATHRIECSDRDAENRMRYQGISAALNEIAPWARENIKREQQRRETWDRIHAVAMAEITRVIVKTVGWVVTGLFAYWLSATHVGSVAIEFVRHLGG